MTMSSRLALCLLKTPLVAAADVAADADTLPGDDVGAPVLPPGRANRGAFARRTPARRAGVAAPTAGAAAYAATRRAAHEGGPLALEPAFTHLHRMANGARHHQA